MTTTPGIDATMVARWLGILHGRSPGHLHICSTDDWAGHTFPTDQLDQAAGYAAQLDAQGREGIYARITSLGEPLAPGKRGGAADSAALPALWADLDLAGPGHAETDLPPDEDAGRAVIAASGLPEPTIWVHSGGGLYPIWLLDQPWTLDGADDLDAAKTLARDWQRIIEHAAASKGWRYGRGVGDLARVLRIPGTTNRKANLARPCRIIDATDRQYTVAQLQAALGTATARITPPPHDQPAASRLAGAVLASATPRPAGDVSPLDDFNARTDWAKILTPAGWKEHCRSDDVTYWTRPGKPTGISASTNALGTDRLHVFTTSAGLLEGGESYSKAGAYAALHYGGDHHAAARAIARQGYGTPLPTPAEEWAENRRALIGMYDQVTTQPVAPPNPATQHDEAGTPPRIWAPEIDVTNPAEAADWLRIEAGKSKLAGLFRRLDQVVHTPREGEDGYVPLSEAPTDADGPAQVRPVNDSALASRITYTYGCYREVKRGDDIEKKQTLFPRSAARTALDVPDLLPNLRMLRGVIHSPIVRPDGSMLTAPGYDRATGLLHLPELTVPPVPEQPSTVQLKAAVDLVDEMLAGFPFVSEHYRANYIGALITPLLRAMCPPPYKLHAIEAHQPGSGKTLLANLSRWIHGGVFRAEMPGEDAELRKQITAILNVTTGPIVVLDNVSGALNSSTLAGLLTSAQWDDRPLGSTSWTRATNDRLWTITANNLNLGGDLPRRTVRSAIDPGVPNPELRTGFAIQDLESWVKERRGELLHALLVMVRAWVVAGMPIPPVRASDGYARWVHTVDGILSHAGIEGGFDHKSTQVKIGSDDDDWLTFLAALHKHFGDRIWTVKEVIASLEASNSLHPHSIPVDALPGDLEAKANRPGVGVQGIAKSLGRWLANREGRWAGAFTVRSAGTDSSNAKQWRIQSS